MSSSPQHSALQSHEATPNKEEEKDGQDVKDVQDVKEVPQEEVKERVLQEIEDSNEMVSKEEVAKFTTIMGCRSVDNFHKLNKIEEGIKFNFMLYL